MTRRLKPKVSKTCSMQQNSSQTQTFKNFSILYKLVLSNMWTLNNAKSFAAFYYARRKFSVCFVLFFRLRETSKFTLSLFFSRVEKMWKLLENMLNRNCRMVSKWYAMYIVRSVTRGSFEAGNAPCLKSSIAISVLSDALAAFIKKEFQCFIHGFIEIK